MSSLPYSTYAYSGFFFSCSLFFFWITKYRECNNFWTAIKAVVKCKKMQFYYLFICYWHHSSVRVGLHVRTTFYHQVTWRSFVLPHIYCHAFKINGSERKSNGKFVKFLWHKKFALTPHCKNFPFDHILYVGVSLADVWNEEKIFFSIRKVLLVFK